ncbi:MAG: ATP synthase subunit I [Polyangia bacterium]
MTTKPLAAIEKTNLVLAVAVTALGGLVWGKPGLLAAGVGAALACLNLWAIHRLAARAMARAAAGANAQAAGLMAALGGKMLILFALVWVAIRVYHLALVPFAIGISVLPVSLVMAGLWIGSTAGEQGKA